MNKNQKAVGVQELYAELSGLLAKLSKQGNRIIIILDGLDKLDTPTKIEKVHVQLRPRF